MDICAPPGSAPPSAKPFLLPPAAPAHHAQRMLSSNVPEFAKAPPARSPRDIRRLAETPAQDAKFPTAAP